MHVVWHHFHFDQLGARLFAHASDDLLQPPVYRIDQHRATVLWAPDCMVLARIDDVVVRPIINHMELDRMDLSNVQDHSACGDGSAVPMPKGRGFRRSGSAFR
ncbi:hypothetical protein [Azospirillum melinis]